MKMNTLARPGTNLAPRLERNDKGRDFVDGDVHGHFGTLRHALADLEVGEHDRVFSLGDLVDHGPDPFAAKDWIAGQEPATRFNLTLRGNHEQMMLEALLTGPPRRRRIWDTNPWSLWEMNGGGWWDTRKPNHSARSWINVLYGLPFCARVETKLGSVGLVHACPVHAQWQHLEDAIGDDGDGAPPHTRRGPVEPRLSRPPSARDRREGQRAPGPRRRSAVRSDRAHVRARAHLARERAGDRHRSAHRRPGFRPPGRRVACTTAPPRNDARRQVSNALEGFK